MNSIVVPMLALAGVMAAPAALLFSLLADVKNDSAAWAQGGSVTAALFLQKFAPITGAWAHMDIFAWNPRARPGWPVCADVRRQAGAVLPADS